MNLKTKNKRIYSKKMKKNSVYQIKKLRKTEILLMLSLGMLLSGCTGAQSQNNQKMEMIQEKEDTSYIRKKADSLDEAVISKISEKREKITFYNTRLGMNYTLSYKGINSIKDKYDEEMSVSQLSPGDLVIVSFVKEDKEIRTIQLKKDAFLLEEVSDYEINKAAGFMMIEDKKYQLSEHLFVFANGKKADLADINMVDVLKVCGTDRTINSIVVDRGHGYIRLSNDEYFIGGWIEVGENLIKPINQDMLLTVPEGEYDILVTNKGYGGTKHVIVEANKETTVDVGDLKGDEVKTGKIIFTITPATATLEIDGKPVETSSPVTLEYGIHQIVLKAEGYKTITKYIKVGSALSNMNIEMEEGSDPTTSGNSVDKDNRTTTNSSSLGTTDSSKNTTNSAQSNDNIKQNEENTGSSLVGDITQTVTDTAGNALVYIDAPEGAQLYLDGVYVGIVPTNFKKNSGTHEVSFRMDGYETRSYTLYFEEDDHNMTFSFADLTKTAQ